MQFEGRRRVSRVLDLTPLIDLVFLLLIYFMLTSHFVRDESLEIDLPAAQSGIAEEREHIQVVLAADGRILLHGQVVAQEELGPRLRAALASQQHKVVRIRGDRNANVGLAVAVLDAARQAGADGVDIVTVAP